MQTLIQGHVYVVNGLLYLGDWLRTLCEVHIVNIGLVEKVSEWLFLERTNLESLVQTDTRASSRACCYSTVDTIIDSILRDCNMYTAVF